MGYFPEDLNVEKFNEILYKMVKEGKKYHKSASIVEWEENKPFLKSTDYEHFSNKNFQKWQTCFQKLLNI